MIPLAPLPPLLPRSVHGGPGATAFTGLDFSVNANPYGPNPTLLQAMQHADHSHYPDPTYGSTRTTLAQWHGVAPEQVALSVGASDLLHRAVRAFVAPGEGLLSLHAPFGELDRAAQLQQAQICILSHLEQLPQALTPNTRLVYIGQPHNPTGHWLRPTELAWAANLCQQHGVWLLLDLAYAPFVGLEPYLHGAVINILSPGKAHGLVGARPAYALAPRSATTALENLAPAWHLPASTNSLLAALPQAQDFLSQTLPRVQQDALHLAHVLQQLGPVVHHHTPYMTLQVGHAATLSATLLEQQIKVRDCASYGLPHCIRVSTQGTERDTFLINALSQLLG